MLAFGSLAAQVPPAPIPEGVQKMLDAPVWYLTYRVTLKLNGPRNHLEERETTGSMLLGLRTQGPGLSAGEAAKSLTTPEEFDRFFSNYANWISGVNPDESKTDAENEAELKRVIEENYKAHHTYRWQYSGPSHMGGTDRGAASGSGTILYNDQVALELDATKRRFKFLFNCMRFLDSESSRKAFTGVDEHGIGSIHYQRVPIERPLYPNHQKLETVNPPLPRFFEGPIPENGGNLSYSSLHAVTEHELRGTLGIEFTFSPKPPVPAELWIEPPPNYQRWQPIADQDERTAGDVIPIKIVLQKPGGGAPQFKPVRYEFFLLDTSREKGVCLNWPPPPAPGAPGAGDPPPYDLQFEFSRNPDMFVDQDGQRMVETVPTQLQREVYVSCFDYGAYGDFAVHAVLENGQLVRGVVRGTTTQERLKLPDRKDGSRIATAFLDQHGVGNLPDDDDAENDPVGDGFKGDGFTLYEEYRGFMNGSGWTSLEPKKKDVFVLNLLRSQREVALGITYFENATGLKVHRKLREDQVLASNQINFNHSAAPHLVDQHVIRIAPGIRVDQGATYANALNIGTPGKAKLIIMPPDLGQARGTVFFATTVAHEMLHCCNVFHHGERDESRWWYYTPNQNPANQMFESDAPPDPNAPAVPLANRVHITVKTESGLVVPPSAFFGAGSARGLIDLGLPQGQHAGAEFCLMRYSIAIAYPSSSDPGVRYLTGGEPIGFGLCSSRDGTGVNGQRSPQSRYGWAAMVADGGPGVLKDRGNCAAQIRVNDSNQAPAAPER